MQPESADPLDLSALINETQDQLIGSVMLSMTDDPPSVPVSEAAVWATLSLWTSLGRPTRDITGPDAVTLFRQDGTDKVELLARDLAFEAMAFRLPVEGEWIVVARHALRQSHYPVTEEFGVGYTWPALTCVFNVSRGVGTGTFDLSELRTLNEIELKGDLSSTGEQPLTPDELELGNSRIILGVRQFYRQ